MQRSPNNLLLKEEDYANLVEFFNYKFGIAKSFFDEYLFIRRGDSIWICSRQIDISFLKLVDFERVGLRCCRWTAGFFKPTSFFLQFVDEHINKNRIEMNTEELQMYLRRESFFVTEKFEQECEQDFQNGYIAVSFNKQIIGCGRFKDGQVFSEFPKKVAHNMKLSQLKELHA